MMSFFQNNLKYGRRRPRRAPPWQTVAPVAKLKRRRKKRHVRAQSPSAAEAKLTQAALRRRGRQPTPLCGGKQRSTTTINEVLHSRCVHRRKLYVRHWNEQPRRRHGKRRDSQQRQSHDAVAVIDHPSINITLDHDLACHITRNIKRLLYVSRPRR